MPIIKKATLPQPKIKEVEIIILKQQLESVYSYLAGFFDGEGHIICYKIENNLHQPTVKIGATNTVITPLELFKESFGGRIVKRERHKDNPKHKDCYEWVCSVCEHVDVALTKMLPYLLIKQEKAEKALLVVNNISEEVVEEVWKFFGSKLYIDNQERYTLQCIICGSEYKRGKRRSITCSRKCRVIYREGRLEGRFKNVK